MGAAWPTVAASAAGRRQCRRLRPAAGPIQRRLGRAWALRRGGDRGRPSGSRRQFLRRHRSARSTFASSSTKSTTFSSKIGAAQRLRRLRVLAEELHHLLLPGRDSASPRRASPGSSRPAPTVMPLTRPISASSRPSRTRRSAMARYSACSVSSSLPSSSSSSRPCLAVGLDALPDLVELGLDHALAAPGSRPARPARRATARFSRSRASWSYSRCICSVISLPQLGQRPRSRASRPARRRPPAPSARFSALAVTSNSAALPASVLGAVVLGEGDVRSCRLSPGAMPSSCSAKPGMKPGPPISTSMSVAVPPGNASPSTLPTIVDASARRPSRAGRGSSATGSSVRWRAASSASALSITSGCGLGLQPGQLDGRRNPAARCPAAAPARP